MENKPSRGQKLYPRPWRERVAEGRVRGPIPTRTAVILNLVGYFCRKGIFSRHAELVWLLLPKSVDFVQNAWFSTASHGLSKRVFCPLSLTLSLEGRGNKDCHCALVAQSALTETLNQVQGDGCFLFL